MNRTEMIADRDRIVMYAAFVRYILIVTNQDGEAVFLDFLSKRENVLEITDSYRKNKYGVKIVTVPEGDAYK